MGSKLQGTDINISMVLMFMNLAGKRRCRESLDDRDGHLERHVGIIGAYSGFGWHLCMRFEKTPEQVRRLSS